MPHGSGVWGGTGPCAGGHQGSAVSREVARHTSFGQGSVGGGIRGSNAEAQVAAQQHIAVFPHPSDICSGRRLETGLLLGTSKATRSRHVTSAFLRSAVLWGASGPFWAKRGNNRPQRRRRTAQTWEGTHRLRAQGPRASSGFGRTVDLEARHVDAQSGGSGAEPEALGQSCAQNGSETHL